MEDYDERESVQMFVYDLKLASWNATYIDFEELAEIPMPKQTGQFEWDPFKVCSGAHIFGSKIKINENSSGTACGKTILEMREIYEWKMKFIKVGKAGPCVVWYRYSWDNPWLVEEDEDGIYIS